MVIIPNYKLTKQEDEKMETVQKDEKTTARNQRITIRLSDDERGILSARAKISGLTEADTIRQLITKIRITKPIMCYDDILLIYQAVKELQMTITSHPHTQSVDVARELSNIYQQLERALDNL